MRLFLIGPMFGIEETNIEEFGMARESLENLVRPHRVSLPQQFFDQDDDRREAMRKTVNEMTSESFLGGRRYDGVALLDGWEICDEALQLVGIAHMCGMACKSVREWQELGNGKE